MESKSKEVEAAIQKHAASADTLSRNPQPMITQTIPGSMQEITAGSFSLPYFQCYSSPFPLLSSHPGPDPDDGDGDRDDDEDADSDANDPEDTDVTKTTKLLLLPPPMQVS
ncbi:hypothetical protein GYMLUDRAFT_915232 [Collybiopsis luxurians FD-317 M1]|nr:hypothetical protein GYMLUDRAFT_915232 [Collybiopsis luxurians FD-317 M1]